MKPNPERTVCSPRIKPQLSVCSLCPQSFSHFLQTTPLVWSVTNSCPWLLWLYSQWRAGGPRRFQAESVSAACLRGVGLTTVTPVWTLVSVCSGNFIHRNLTVLSCHTRDARSSLENHMCWLLCSCRHWLCYETVGWGTLTYCLFPSFEDILTLQKHSYTQSPLSVVPDLTIFLYFHQQMVHFPPPGWMKWWLP